MDNVGLFFKVFLIFNVLIMDLGKIFFLIK